MIYKALVKGLDPHIEEEVILEIDGIEFTGFSSVCPNIILGEFCKRIQLMQESFLLMKMSIFLNILI